MAKGDVGTGTIVGSAVFNILFVIGICGIFVKAVHLNWWPVFRDSAFYAIAVLILTLVIWDGEVGYLESAFMLLFYAVYILIMKFNVELRELLIQKVDVTRFGLPIEQEEQGHGFLEEEVDEERMGLQQQPQQQQQRQQDWGSREQDSWGGTAAAAPSYQSTTTAADPWSDTWSTQASSADPWADVGKQHQAQRSLDVFPSQSGSMTATSSGKIPPSRDPKKTSLFEAANRQILKHKRLFRPKSRFRAAADLVIVKKRKERTSAKISSRKQAGPSRAAQKRAMTAVRQETTRKPSIAPDPEEILRLVSGF